MNQIICTSNCYTSITNNKKISKRKLLFKIQFFIIIITMMCLIIYYIYSRYNLTYAESLSKKIMDNYEIIKLYQNVDSSKENLKGEIVFYENTSYFVIGTIEIEKLGITYPILSDISKDALKISPCRFYGPMPNQAGNLCIAGHNYKNDTFFSNLFKLEKGDKIKIYDNQKKEITYEVFSTYTISQDDLSCINQDTGNLKIITLVTCDSKNDKLRNIVRAIEI